MLGFSLALICLVAGFFITVLVYFAIGPFVKNRNKRIAIGMLVALLICGYYLDSNVVPTRI